MLWDRMKACDLCPRECGVNRLDGERGFCKATSTLRIASFAPHYGEERILVGAGGSGTIFFSHCNLGCVFCQNWDISYHGSGKDYSLEELAGMMLHLQKSGCHNINVVTPTHYSPHILFALDMAASRGLRVPLVYNTSGWERSDVLDQLDGIVDIYLADYKYTDPEMASAYSAGASDYVEVTQQALLEMNRQVGVVWAEQNRVVYRGLMIRHLVMPGEVSGSLEAMRWIAANLPTATFVNIMLQYRPTHLAHLYPEIDRPLSRKEYAAVVAEARTCGLNKLDVDI